MSTTEPAGLNLNVHDVAQAKALAVAAQDDHPEGAAIRRQVEFYFSDENLPTDLHLLQQCGGRDNVPVSINKICGFKKMRSYKPKSLVVVALRKSAFLEVSPDGKTIKRKTPLQGRTLLDEDSCLEDDEIAYDPRTRKPIVKPNLAHPQHKKILPGGMSKNMRKPTGFESSYVEPPIRPEEAEEEERMYDEDKPFVVRVEIAIQRFKQKRRMHQMYAMVFDKLMSYGGINSSPRVYQGVSRTDLKDMDAEEIVRVLATHNVPWDRADERQWSVDFYGVGAAFLSSWYPLHYGYAPTGIKNACQVLRSFYNYLRYHRVCPEYDEQLQAALKVCDLAENELIKVDTAGLALPGDFNAAASTLFGGAQAGLFAADKTWALEAKTEGVDTKNMGLRDQEARIKFSTGIAALGTDEQQNLIGAADVEIIKKESVGLEVMEIHLPDDITREVYAAQTEVVKEKLDPLAPLGKLKCRAWYADDCDEWDLPKDKYPDGKPHKADQVTSYEFWVEDSVLEKCFIGMKIDGNVLTLECGVTILDEVKQTYCSFYTWLANELWMENKPKEVRWLAKGLPDDDERVEINGSDQDGQEQSHENGEFDDE